MSECEMYNTDMAYYVIGGVMTIFRIFIYSFLLLLYTWEYKFFFKKRLGMLYQGNLVSSTRSEKKK